MRIIELNFDSVFPNAICYAIRFVVSIFDLFNQSPMATISRSGNEKPNNRTPEFFNNPFTPDTPVINFSS